MEEDHSLDSICYECEGTKKIGFSSDEFEKIDLNENFKNSIDNIAIQKIKYNFEGKCIGNGYILPESVKLIERSNILFPHESLQIYYSLNVKYSYKICNPNPGVKLKCKIVTKNKIGLLGRLNHNNSPLVILIPDDLCFEERHKEIIQNSDIGDIIDIIVVGKKFEQNDRKITVIGELV